MRSLAWIALAACAVGPDFKRPAPPRAGRYTARGVHQTSAADGVAQVVHPGEQLAATWWQLFHSSALDALVRTALAGNADLEAAEASLRRSEYNLRAGYGVFFPQADVTASAQRQRFSPSEFGSPAPANVFNLYTLGGAVSYTLDLFGGERRTVEALRAQVDVQCYTLAAAHLTVTGNVIDTAIARAAYAEEIAASEELVTSLRGEVAIARTQAQAGTATYAAVLALETQLANTSATIPPLRQQLAHASALLASLVGRTPAEWQPPAIALDDLSLPRELPVSLPSQLVRQRPDVLVAEATLHVSSANIGVATAALFPSITLSGTYGLQSSSLAALFTPARRVWSFGGSLLQPIFHGGQLLNQRRAAIEAYRQALASYRSTVLNAFTDVATALDALVHDADAVDARAHALAAATDARKLVLVNYQAGLVSYLDVLNAEAQYQQARIGQIGARAQRLQDTVALFIALGGGWWHATGVPCAR
jgi:NodT family efflux transporter outer membrane factor (OMF) lipoprotein